MWSDVRRVAAATLVAVASASTARAQAPAPSPAASPVAPAASPAPAAKEAPPAEDRPELRQCNPTQEICVTAAHLEVPEKGHTQLRGFVDIQSQDSRIQADQVDLYEMPRVDGTTARRMVAVGNVVFMRGEERLAGERLELELDTSRGTFDDASGYVSPGVLVEADKIERIDGSTYRIKGGRFTSCTQPNPRWNFSASSATLLVDDKVKARNVVFRVKGVPAFYIPYFEYPIQTDQRSTGFLFPHFGTSAIRGFNVGSGFFWAMSRSLDQTLYADHYSKYGWGFGHELRYMQKAPSRGTFRTYFFRRSAGGTTKWEHDFNWNAIQNFPWKVRGSLLVQDNSSVDFQEQFQESLDLASSRRTRFWTAKVDRAFGSTNLQLMADSQDFYFYDPNDESLRFNRRRHLPALVLSRSARRIKGAGGVVAGFDARAESLQVGDQAVLDSYERFDVNPRLSRPLSKPWVQLNPLVQARYTRYGASRDPDTGELVPLGLDRRYAEASLEMRGPLFSRVFNTPGNFYSERYKHVFGPEVTYTYRSPLEQFHRIPRFDGLDIIPGTNEVRYGFVQQFYAKRPGRSGKPEPYEFLSWRVAQTYYVNADANLNNEFDPNFSTPFRGPGDVPAHRSPIQSLVRFRPTPAVNANFTLEYDVNFREVRSLSLATSANYRRAGVDARWYRSRLRLGDQVRERDTVRTSARLQLVPDTLTLAGSADYDVSKRNLIQSTARLRYDVQCCGFIAEMVQSDYNLNSDRQFRFSIELANIGSMGSFLGVDAVDQNRGFLSGGR